MENIRLGPVLPDRESVPTASCSPDSSSLRFVVAEPSRMKSVSTEGCHVGHFRESVGTACCTYGQSNATSGSSHCVLLLGSGARGFHLRVPDLRVSYEGLTSWLCPVCWHWQWQSGVMPHWILHMSFYIICLYRCLCATLFSYDEMQLNRLDAHKLVIGSCSLCPCTYNKGYLHQDTKLYRSTNGSQWPAPRLSKNQRAELLSRELIHL